MKTRKFRIKEYSADSLSIAEYIRLFGNKNVKKFFVVQVRIFFLWFAIKLFGDENEWYANNEAKELLKKLNAK